MCIILDMVIKFIGKYHNIIGYVQILKMDGITYSCEKNLKQLKFLTRVDYFGKLDL